MILSADQIAAITAYTGTTYRAINDYLRNDGSGDLRREQQVRLLDQALASNQTRFTLFVYRGVSESFAEELAGYGLAAGDIIRDRAFLSTSQLREIASSFMRDEDGMILAIGVPVDAEALDIAAFSTYPGEAEILLARNAPLRVVGYDDAADILELELLGDE